MNVPPAPAHLTVHQQNLWLKWMYAGGALLLIVANVLALAGLRLAPVAAFSRMLSVANVAVGLGWLHGAWSSVPAGDRDFTPLGRVSATSATLRVLIPFYNLYWCFAVHGMLCRALNESLGRRGFYARVMPAAAFFATVLSGAARVASILPVPGLFTVVYAGATLLWVAYMAEIDHARRLLVVAWVRR
jgi:hypothetical protein